MSVSADSLYLSVLVPIYNEEENLESLSRELGETLQNLSRPYEVLYVEDGSVDRSFEILCRLVKANPHFKVIRLGRNFGQTAALSAGIEHCRGRFIACLDADLQNDPRDIPLLLQKIEEGYDLASGWRKKRQDPWLTRRLPSQVANAAISYVTGVSLHDYGCTLKVYRREYLKKLRLFGEMHRFIPAFAGFMGAKIAEVEVHHRPRKGGVSKYGLSRVLKVLLDLITVKFMEQYLTKPIYLFGGGGAFMGGTGVLLSGWVLYKKYCLGIFVKDQPLFLVSIFFFLVGIQLLLLGLLAEILIRVYYDIKDKPTYFIRETIGFDKAGKTNYNADAL